MDFILSQSGQNLRLPVPPEKFEIQTGNLNTVVTVEELGEIQLMGKSKLSLLTIETFWPAKQYTFCQYSNFMLPYEAMAVITKWKESGSPIQVIITGTSINMPMSIDDFIYSEKDGTRDVYFSIAFKEYKYIMLQTQTINAASKSTSINRYSATPSRPSNKQVANTYTVVSGDNLSKIAQRVYGSSSKWRDLFAKNSGIIKNPNLIYPGQVLTL